MAVGQDYSFNNPYYAQNLGFRAIENPVAQSPTPTTQNVDKPDTFVKKVEKEKNKKSTKKAIAAGSAVLGIAGLITILNPKNASKILQKIKKLQAKTRVKMDTGKQNFFKTKFGHFIDKTLDVSSRAILATGNFNNGKDIVYKNLCSNKRQYNGVKNKTLRKGLIAVNDVFTDIMTKINNNITKGFDTISKKTVQGKYKSANKNITYLETSLKEIRGKLLPEEQVLFDKKLAEIAKNKEFFSETNLTNRFAAQEKGMIDLNLEEQVNKKMTNFFHGYKGQKNLQGVWEHTDKNLTLWSEDILKPHRDLLEKEGKDAVSKLFGEKNGKKGGYDELLDIARKHLSPEEQNKLDVAYKEAAKKLRKANKSECIDYYDKKRDLVLGGAPTDILTGVAGLTAGGIAMACADTKEDRRARILGGNFALIPTIIGVGTSIAMTAMLYSGATGLMVGFGVGAIISKLGSLANKLLFGYDEDAIHEAKVQARKESCSGSSKTSGKSKNTKPTGG